MCEDNYMNLDDLLKMFDTASGTVARHLDYDDGKFDGYIEINTWNDWLKKHNLEPVNDMDKIPVMDAIRVLESLQKRN